MTKQERVEKATRLLLDERGVDYILEHHITPDFVQCICSIGGDTVTYRVYNDGTVTEK